MWLDKVPTESTRKWDVIDDYYLNFMKVQDAEHVKEDTEWDQEECDSIFG